jgi:hypothetical protein
MRLFRRPLLWAWLKLKIDHRPVLLARACRNLMGQLRNGLARAFYLWRIQNTEILLTEEIHTLTRETKYCNGVKRVLGFARSRRIRWALIQLLRHRDE